MPWKDPPLPPIYINPGPSVPPTPVPQEPLPTIIWNHPVWRERFSLIVFAVIVGILGYTAINGLVAPVIATSAIVGGLALLLFMFIVRFESLPEVAQKSKLLSDLHKLQTEIIQIKDAIKRLHDEKNELCQEENQKVSEITSKQRECAQREKNEIDRIEHELQGILSSLNLQRQALNREKNEIDRINFELQGILTRLNSQRQALNPAETNEIAQALRNLQNQFLANQLVRYHLSDASIQGIGPEMTRRLLAAGIRTAADVEYWKVRSVYGIGDWRASSLVSWRRDTERLIRIPQSLPHEQESKIRLKYQALHQSLTLQETNVKQDAKQKESAIRLKYQALRQSLDLQETNAKQDARQRKDAVLGKYRQEQDTLSKQLQDVRDRFAKQHRDLDEKISEEKKLVSEKHWTLAKVRREVDAYRRVNFATYLKRILLLA